MRMYSTRAVQVAVADALTRHTGRRHDCPNEDEWDIHGACSKRDGWECPFFPDADERPHVSVTEATRFSGDYNVMEDSFGRCYAALAESRLEEGGQDDEVARRTR